MYLLPLIDLREAIWIDPAESAFIKHIFQPHPRELLQRAPGHLFECGVRVANPAFKVEQNKPIIDMTEDHLRIRTIQPGVHATECGNSCADWIVLVVARGLP